MRGKFEDLLGRRIKGVVVKESQRHPENQVFLLFSDGTYFEFYGASMRGANGICWGDLESVRRYMAAPDRPITFQRFDDSIA